MVELAHQATNTATLDFSTDADVRVGTLYLTVGGTGEGSVGGGGGGSGYGVRTPSRIINQRCLFRLRK